MSVFYLSFGSDIFYLSNLTNYPEPKWLKYSLYVNILFSLFYYLLIFLNNFYLTNFNQLGRFCNLDILNIHTIDLFLEAIGIYTPYETSVDNWALLYPRLRTSMSGKLNIISSAITMLCIVCCSLSIFIIFIVSALVRWA